MEISSGWLTAPCLPLPLRTRTSSAPTTGWATLSRYPPALVGATEAAESPPKLTAHLLTGITAGMVTAPLGGPLQVTISLSSDALMSVVGSARGAELLVSQDWATGPCRFAQGAFAMRTPAPALQAAQRGAYPPGLTHPSRVPATGELAAPLQ